VLTAVLAGLGSPVNVISGTVGSGVMLLAVLALVPLVVSARRPDYLSLSRILALILTGAVALAICPGRAGLFRGWLAPYAWLEALVPGFSLIRVPSRFGILVSVCASALAGLGAASTYRVLRERSQRAAAVLLCTGAAAAVAATISASRGLPVVAMPVATGATVPRVYRWLAAYGAGRPLLELPVLSARRETGTKAGAAEAMAMYFSTYHWLPLLNGYSGYVPASFGALMTVAMRLPDQEAMQTLVDCTGLRWILVHQPSPLARAAWSRVPGVSHRGTFRRDDGEDDLYEVRLGPQEPCSLAGVL